MTKTNHNERGLKMTTDPRTGLVTLDGNYGVMRQAFIRRFDTGDPHLTLSKLDEIDRRWRHLGKAFG
jgi:hypothetical protein